MSLRQLLKMILKAVLEILRNYRDGKITAKQAKEAIDKLNDHNK